MTLEIELSSLTLCVDTNVIWLKIAMNHAIPAYNESERWGVKSRLIKSSQHLLATVKVLESRGNVASHFHPF